MNRKKLKLVLATTVMSLALQGVAQAAVVGPGPAPGSDNNDFEFTGEYKSTVTGSYAARKDKFKGYVNSNYSDADGVLEDPSDEDRMCVAGRKVEVFKNRSTKPDLSMGTDKADASGFWSVSADVRRGSYYAKVTQTEYLVRTYYGVNEYAVCLAGKSAEIKP